MSEEQLATSKDRTVEEYLRCKERLATLNAQAQRTARLLDGVSTFLRQESERFRAGEQEEALSEKALTLMNDLHNTRNDMHRLRQSLVEMGIDVNT
jgi:chromosome segregation ATPase